MAPLLRLTGSAVFGALVVLAATPSVAQQKGATDEVTPAESLAAQLRTQGFPCDRPVTAERDAARSKPDEAVWIVRCANASYRMRPIPDMAAVVSPID